MVDREQKYKKWRRNRLRWRWAEGLQKCKLQ